jgi:hypothetical protein
VSRHEKSFHPFELARQHRSEDTDTVDVPATLDSEGEKSDEPQSFTLQIHSVSSEPRAEARVDQFMERQLSPSTTTRAQRRVQGGTSLSATKEQHPSDLTDLPMLRSGQSFPQIPTSGSDMNQFLGVSQTPVMDSESLNDILNDPGEQSIDPALRSTITSTQISATGQNFPTGQSLEFSGSNWHDHETIHGDGLVAQDPSGMPTMHPILDRQTENYFQDVDIFSMLPNGGTNLEVDFSISSYLFNSGYSPPIETTTVQQGHGSIDTHERSDPTPTSISAVSEPFRIPSTAGCFTRLPRVVTEAPRKIPIPTVDEEVYALIVKDIKERLTIQQMEDFSIPTSQNLERFLTSYVTCFHRHFPIIHLASLDLKRTPSPLILSMCAIGALYRLSRKTAKDIWYWADIMVENVRYHAAPRKVLPGNHN